MWFYIGCDLAGDGFCDDSTNDGTCQFDGGDCCLPEVKKDYCVICQCYASQQYQERKYLVILGIDFWHILKILQSRFVYVPPPSKPLA